MISIKQGLVAFGLWVLLMIIGELILSIGDKEDERMEVKEQILHYFRDINHVYNSPYMYETLEKALDKLRRKERESTIEKIDSYIDIIKNSGMGKKKSLEFIKKYIIALKEIEK